MADDEEDQPETMGLADFIECTLADIAAGVSKAARRLMATSSRTQVAPVTAGDRFRHSVEVSFDVALTVGRSKTGEGGVGVKVLGMLSVGGKGELAHNVESVNRVQFKIPVALAGTNMPARDLPSREPDGF